MAKPWYRVRKNDTGRVAMVPPGHYTLTDPGWTTLREGRKKAPVKRKAKEGKQ